MNPSRRVFLKFSGPAATLALAAGAGLFKTGEALAATEPGQRVTLPDIRLLDNAVITARSLAGKPVVIYFWASWCPYCAKQSPYIEALYRRTRTTDLQMISVSVDKTAADARNYLAQKGYTFPVTMDAGVMERALGTRRALPKTYVINRSGMLAFSAFGEMFEEDVLELVRFAALPAVMRC